MGVTASVAVHGSVPEPVQRLTSIVALGPAALTVEALRCVLKRMTISEFTQALFPPFRADHGLGLAGSADVHSSTTVGLIGIIPVDDLQAYCALSVTSGQVPPTEQDPDRQQVSPAAEQMVASSLQFRTVNGAWLDSLPPLSTMTEPVSEPPGTSVVMRDAP